MRAMRCAKTALVLVPLAVALSPLGCQEKMGVEKRAEQIAASASATTSASVSAAPDPKEERYAKLRKDLKDRTLQYMSTLQRIYLTGKKEDMDAFRAFFPATKEAEKEANDITKEAAFVGKEGMAIKSFEVQEVTFDEKLQNSTVDLYEEEMQRGKPRCIIFKLKWRDDSGTWHRTEKTPPKVVPCN